MASNRLPGKMIGIKIDGDFVECELSCDVSYETDLLPSSSVESGGWKESLPGVKSWSVSVNAGMLLNNAGLSYNKVLNAFLNGTKIYVNIVAKINAIDSFSIYGYVSFRNGGFGAAASGMANWNALLEGNGKMNIGKPDSNDYRLLYGYRSEDPFGDEPNLVPQFSVDIENGAIALPLNFTSQSNANYLFVIVPFGQHIFNVWENNQFNFGEIPDYLWRKSSLGGYDYYMTRTVQYITSNVPTITLKYVDSLPNAFNFNAINGVEVNSLQVSNTLTITGITQSLPLSIQNGEYSINGGSFTSVDGNISNGDTLQVRQMSSSSFSSTTVATVFVGSYSTSFNVSTRAAQATSISYSYSKGLSPVVDITGIIYANDNPIKFLYGSEVGSLPVMEGDNIYVRLIHNVETLPWPAQSRARISYERNSVVVQDSGNVFNANIQEIGQVSFVAEVGVSQNIIMTSSSPSTEYSTVTLNLDNQSSAPISSGSVIVRFKLYDTTTGNFVINTGQFIQPQSDIGFNYINDSNTSLLEITNNSSFNLKFTVSNAFTGGSFYDEIIVYANGSANYMSNIPKSGILITYVDV